ncbi:MAG: choice-of-anchor tandem repeat NxxGxxAF-containing protein [Phycisphaerae bacterium]
MNRYALLGSVGIHAVFLAATASGQPYVRISDAWTVPAFDGGAEPANTIGTRRGTDPCCAAPAGFDFAAYAWHAQAAPEGGTMYPLASANPAIINDAGRIAFMSRITGPERNQGVFVADESGLTPIAIGCGGGGGSGDPGSGVGDPSPLGGTFSGFFGGTVFAPPINNNGDVLFIADVDGGSAPRGLFLYQADSGQIIRVAAVGDPSPLGGTLTAVGPGSMNNSGEIVFIAKNSDTGDVNILKWTEGVVTKHVAVGDPVPGGGTFSLLAGESLGYADGTWIPIGDVPGINDSGQVSFFGIVQGGVAGRGLFVTTDGVHEWYVEQGEATPAGGTYFDFQAPLLNDLGEIACFADVNLGGGQYTAGWFVGTPGNYRKALAFYDEIAGGEVFIQAISRNPLRGLDNCGNLLLWCALRYPSGDELDTLLISPPEGERIIVAQEGQPNVLGGSIGGMNGWPAMNDRRQGMLSCYTPGTPGGIFNAHFVFTGWLPGDLDGDDDVDLSDLAQLLAHYGMAEGATYHDGDLDGDGDVDLTDLAALLAAYGVSCP